MISWMGASNDLTGQGVGESSASTDSHRADRRVRLGPERRVVMLVNSLRHYHARFYDLLRRRLATAGVVLDLVYSTPRGAEGGRGDTVDLAWAHHVRQRRIGLGRYELTFQESLDIAADADLVVVQQATKRIENYLLLVKQAFGGPRVAFWGHGRNFQATSRLQSLAESVKRRLLRQAHWFFAYNDVSADVLEESGYPAARVTVVGNTIDTRSLAEARDSVTEDDRHRLRQRLRLVGEHVGVYCGAMYPEKRLPFLIDAANEIRSMVPDFELVCIGDGIDRYIVDEAAATHDWIYSVGPQFGDDLARHLSLARVFLMPGLVGLAVLDSFVLGVPLVTTTDALHSPEIAYLEHGVNGLIVPGDGSDGSYATAVASVLTDDAMHARLVAGCRQSSQLYDLEGMVERFAVGVLAALGTDGRGIDRPHATTERPREITRESRSDGPAGGANT